MFLYLSIGIASRIRKPILKQFPMYLILCFIKQKAFEPRFPIVTASVEISRIIALK
jgi:hypothetical protein